MAVHLFRLDRSTPQQPEVFIAYAGVLPASIVNYLSTSKLTRGFFRLLDLHPSTKTAPAFQDSLAMHQILLV